MYDVYKVTAAAIKKTPKGYDVYNLRLNNSIWASKLFPLRDRDKRHDATHKLFEQHGKSLDFLVGRYIAISLEDSQYGKNFDRIASFDVLADFKKLLDDAKPQSFMTNINIFEFLRGRGYPINPDSSITLKPPYAHLNIRKYADRVVCYPSSSGADAVTLENLPLIYKEFFEGKFIENFNDDRAEEYFMNPVSIGVFRRTFHKNKSGVESSDSFVILRVGDKLSAEHAQFLSAHTKSASCN